VLRRSAPYDPLRGTLEAGMAGAEKKGWWGRNWKWFVPVTVLFLVLLCALCGFGMLGSVMGIIKSTEPYETALERARADARVVEVLGEPIEDGFFVQGNVNVTNQSGQADLAIPVSGPNGSGTIHVDATRTAGRWSYATLELQVEGATERIDLREE
jgi:hypothetical protein